MQIKSTYSWRKSVGKALVGVLLFAVPVLLEALPEEWMNLTLGGALTGLWNFVKYNWLTPEAE